MAKDQLDYLGSRCSVLPDEELVSAKLHHQHPKTRPKPAALQFQLSSEKKRLFHKEATERKTLRLSCQNLIPSEDFCVSAAKNLRWRVLIWIFHISSFLVYMPVLCFRCATALSTVLRFSRPQSAGLQLADWRPPPADTPAVHVPAAAG